MAYRGGFGRPASRLMATMVAIVPASIIAGTIGTACLTAGLMGISLFTGGFDNFSLDGLLAALVFTGALIAVGSIGGTFMVGFYLVIFGLPVALLLGEHIRTSAGLLAAMATGAAAAFVAVRWLWGMTAVSGEPVWHEEALVVLCFVLPAAWFYRRQVIAMLDELPA